MNFSNFEIAGGTIIGKDHVLSGKNNQDSFYWSRTDKSIVAVLCDGCGSSLHSEVGAKIGTRLVASAIEKRIRIIRSFWGLSRKISSAGFLREVKLDVIAQLRILADAMGENFSKVIDEFFFFTIVGVVITPLDCLIFSLGDGVVVVNGEILKIGPFLDNRPPYLAYDGLVDTKFTTDCPELLKFQVHTLLSTFDLNSILLGTDGISDFIKAEEKNLPGKKESVGPIEQFWKKDCYFKNKDMVRRKLAALNKVSFKVDWDNEEVIREKGLLPDDTTLVVIRRKDKGGAQDGGVS